MSLTLRLSLLLAVLMGGALLALLSQASESESRLDGFFSWLLTANIFVVGAMALLAVLVIVRAVRRVRNKVFGSRLMIRLALAFAVMGIVPVALVSLASVQFLARSIDSWFSESVESALDSGRALGRATVEALQAETILQARRLAVTLESVSDEELSAVVSTATSGREGLEVLVLNLKGQVLAVQSSSLFQLLPDVPDAELIEKARAARQLVMIEPIAGAPPWALQIRALVLSIRPEPGLSQVRMVQWKEPIPQVLAESIYSLNEGFTDYQQLDLGKEGIRKIYGVTLSLALLLAVFSAVLMAVLLSGWLSGPLRALEKATKAVGSGDYRSIREDTTDHELNDLVRSFNEMTRQLLEAQSLARENQQKTEAAREFLSQVLSHISAGVLVFDTQWRLLQFNQAAQRLLGKELGPSLFESTLYELWPNDQIQSLMQALDLALESQEQLEFSQGTGLATFVVSGTRLPEHPSQEAGPRFIVVFDDVTGLISAERARAWAEMARRMAHEIKNPLTPIQLSAERLQLKLTDRLAPDDRELLQRSCNTIVDQVRGLKTMVDEFRNYARLPSANPERLNLSSLISEVMPLYVSDPSIELTQADECWVWADRGQLIQILHNLVQNAQDACSSPGFLSSDASGSAALHEEEKKPKIKIACKKWTSTKEPRCLLIVEDNGPGIPPDMLTRLFEPYVTTKPKGTGLGLAIVKKVAEENRADIRLENRVDASGRVLGAKAVLSLPMHSKSSSAPAKPEEDSHKGLNDV
ncbi:MAG: ATP-binding protein [Burkholderiaceae bacterium]|nr:ATP-binding protein [Burkholderiaceae bacterium]MDP4828949.1 ATP-binding protein [Burkholderiaceae bacterium]MDP4949414.1 ATP-binding protein [Burkholderiaceae bacterium]